MNEDTPRDEDIRLDDGIQLIYLPEDSGRLTDTGVYLKPGAENVAEVGTDVGGELARVFVERGICAVYRKDASAVGGAAPEGKKADGGLPEESPSRAADPAESEADARTDETGPADQASA